MEDTGTALTNVRRHSSDSTRVLCFSAKRTNPNVPDAGMKPREFVMPSGHSNRPQCLVYKKTLQGGHRRGSASTFRYLSIGMKSDYPNERSIALLCQVKTRCSGPQLSATSPASNRRSSGDVSLCRTHRQPTPTHSPAPEIFLELHCVGGQDAPPLLAEQWHWPRRWHRGVAHNLCFRITY